jgi:hypothetical protein
MVDTVKSALPQPGKIKRRFAQRLAGHRARIDARATQLRAPLDQCNALPKVGSLRHALFPCRARADHDQVKRLHVERPSGL